MKMTLTGIYSNWWNWSEHDEWFVAAVCVSGRGNRERESELKVQDREEEEEDLCCCCCWSELEALLVMKSLLICVASSSACCFDTVFWFNLASSEQNCTHVFPPSGNTCRSNFIRPLFFCVPTRRNCAKLGRVAKTMTRSSTSLVNKQCRFMCKIKSAELYPMRA